MHQGTQFIFAAGFTVASLALVVGCSADSSGSGAPRNLQNAAANTATTGSTASLQPTASGVPTASSGGTGGPGGGQPQNPSTPTATLDAGGAATNCDPLALDQTDCQCSKTGITRSCYSGAANTRNIGVCKDGVQTCVATSGEFGAKWGPCMEQALPTTCSMGVDAHCTGKVGCDDPQCASQLNCVKDAGTKDAGIPPGCHIVQGFNGNGTFADGGLYCEGQLPGFFGGLP